MNIKSEKEFYANELRQKALRFNADMYVCAIINEVYEGNRKLLSLKDILLYDRGKGGSDYGNKEYYFRTSNQKRNVAG